MVSFFGNGKGIKISKETQEEMARESRRTLQSLRGTENTTIQEFKPITNVFHESRNPSSMHGVAPLVAKVNDKWFFTNVIIDPLARVPPFGDSNKTWGYIPWTENELITESNDSDGEIEEARGLPRMQYRSKDQKIGTLLGDSLSFMESGRTLLNGAELLKLQDETNLGMVTFLSIPWDKLTSAQEHQFMLQLMHDTVTTDTKKGGNFKLKTLAILCAHGLDKSAWSDGVILLTSRPDKYADEVQSESWENIAKVALENNI